MSDKQYYAGYTIHFEEGEPKDGTINNTGPNVRDGSILWEISKREKDLLKAKDVTIFLGEIPESGDVFRPSYQIMGSELPRLLKQLEERFGDK